MIYPATAQPFFATVLHIRPIWLAFFTIPHQKKIACECPRTERVPNCDIELLTATTTVHKVKATQASARYAIIIVEVVLLLAGWKEITGETTLMLPGRSDPIVLLK